LIEVMRFITLITARPGPHVARYIGYAGSQRRWFVLLGVLIPADIARQLISPLVMGWFVDAALSGRPTIELIHLAGWFFGLALVGQALAVAAAYIAARVAWATTNMLRTDLLAHCMRQDGGFQLRHPPGELVDRVDGDVTLLAGVMSGMVLEVLAQALLVVGILAALFHLDWRFGLMFAPFAAVMLVLLRRLAGRAVPLLTARRQAGAELLAFLEERLAGLDDLRANGANQHTVDQLWQRIRVHYQCARRAAVAAVAWPVAVQGLSAVNFSVALAMGVWLYQHAGLSVGTVFAGLSYAMLLRIPLMNITTRFQDIEDVVVSVRRLNQLFDEHSPVRDGPGTLAPGPKAVVLDRVSFSYGTQPALRGVSLDLPAGHSLALVGRTGSGKSTLVRLLFRQYDPDAGVIRVGGADLRQVSVASLRSRITLVTQDVHVLPSTLRDNLTLFDPSVPDERLWCALAEVGLEQWLASLPDGLDTMLGDDGRGLSAGQAQLVALTRAFLTDPDVVLLDEPSAMLDPHTERLLHRAIARFVRGRTAIIVAHRMETLRMVDHVLLLADGRVLDVGERAPLLLAAHPDLESLVQSGDLLR
jgi:ATP-binding cassette, subfamily B, bacterial